MKNKKYKNPDWLYKQHVILLKSASRISQEFGYNHKTIRKYLNEYNINTAQLSEEERFWIYIDIKENDKCWNWKKGLTSK